MLRSFDSGKHGSIRPGAVRFRTVRKIEPVGGNLQGLRASSAIVAPSRSHAEATRRCYGVEAIDVVYNASLYQPRVGENANFVFAAGRWWDEGKNVGVVDDAAPLMRWPVVMAGAAHSPNGQSASIRNAEFRGSLDHRRTMELMERAGMARPLTVPVAEHILALVQREPMRVAAVRRAGREDDVGWQQTREWIRRPATTWHRHDRAGMW